MNTDEIKKLQEFNHLFIQVVQGVIDSTPNSWDSIIFIIHKRSPEVECEFLATKPETALEVPSHLHRLSQEFADFQRTDNWDNDWLKVTIGVSFSDPSVDFSATREFTYPDTKVESLRKNPSVESLPPESFWRQEI